VTTLYAFVERRDGERWVYVPPSRGGPRLDESGRPLPVAVDWGPVHDVLFADNKVGYPPRTFSSEVAEECGRFAEVSFGFGARSLRELLELGRGARVDRSRETQAHIDWQEAARRSWERLLHFLHGLGTPDDVRIVYFKVR
jgi:hypothetical protein